VKLLALTVEVELLNVVAVPLRLKPWLAISPCAVAFTVAVCPLHVMLVTVVAKPAIESIRIAIIVFISSPFITRPRYTRR